MKQSPSSYLTMPRKLFFLFLFLVLLMATLEYATPVKETLNSESFTFTIGSVTISLYTLCKGLITLIILFWLANAISALGTKQIQKIQQLKASNRTLFIKVFQIITYFLVFIISLDVLGIDLTVFAVIGGAIGIGIGFGLQKITSNFISGLILLFEKSVEENDLIELTDGTYGFVRHTGARYTLVETFDGKEVMIPNEDFITNRVINWTYNNTQGRIEINVGVSYDSDIEQALELILEAAKEHPRCSIDPEPQCYLEEYGDSSVNFLLYFWVDDVTQGRLEPKSDVMRTIWKKFKQYDITIPYPQRDVHIKNPEALQ